MAKDTSKTNILVFLRPFTIENPTLEQQNSFMFCEIINEIECGIKGKFYTNDVLYGKDLEVFIREEVAKFNPEWVVAENESATATLKLKRRKKILINPAVSFDDLNNIPEYYRQNTWGFFDRDHEKDYERFNTVYPHAAFFPCERDISIYAVKDVITTILECPESDLLKFE